MINRAKLLCAAGGATMLASLCMSAVGAPATFVLSSSTFKDGTLTIMVFKKGEEPKETPFKVADDVKVTVLEGEEKKVMTAKEAFKDLKTGTLVTVVQDGDKIVSITLGTAKKK